MMKTSVRSSRIERGRYRADLRQETAIHVFTDHSIEALQDEIIRLKTTLEEFQQTADAKSAEVANESAEAAYKQGFEDGRMQGYEEGWAAVQEAADIIRALAGEIQSGLDAIWKGCRDETVELTLAIARKIVGNVAEQYDNLARELVARCMAMTRDQIRIKILVNPRDAEVLRKAKVELMSMAEGVKEIEIAERASVERGGVLIETEGGQVDGRLGEQLDAVEKALKPGWSRPEVNSVEHNKSEESE